MPKFSLKIYKIGINPVVDPPDDVIQILFEQAGHSTGPIPVCGRLNGAEYIQTLVKHAGKWRLYINGQMLADSGLAVGDIAKIEIAFDPGPRQVPMPPQLASALRKNKAARIEFDRLSPSRQKEIFRYLGSLKTQASIDKNIERVIHHLLGRETDAQHGLMRRKREK